MVDSLKGSLAGLVSQQDAARNGLKQGRDEMGRFTASGQGAASTLTKGFNAIASGAKAVTPALAALGGTVVMLATGQVPTATQAGAALGNVLSGALTGAASKASDALSKLGPEGAAAGAALEALAGVGGAVVATLLTVSGMIVDVTQKMDLMRDRFAAFTGSAASGKALQAALGKLDLPFASSQVNAWALALEKAGVAASKVADRVKAVAAAEALGEGGGEAATAFFKRLGEGGPAADKFMQELGKGSRRAVMMLKEMGVSMADLGGQAAVAKMSAEQLQDAVSKALQKKGAGPLADLALTLPNILTKAQEGLRSVFADLGPVVKPFMQEVKALFGEFNKGGPIVKQIKPIVTEVFVAVFRALKNVTMAVHEMVQGFLGTAKVTTIWTTIGSVLRTVVGVIGKIVSFVGGLLANEKVVLGLKIAAIGLAVGLFLALAPLLLIMAAAAGIVAAFVAVGTGIAYLIGYLADFASAAWDTGKAIVDGLIGGVDIGAFVAKMEGLASQGLAAFKSIFGIASPSKVMREHAQEDIVEDGAAEGVDRGAPAFKKSMTKMREGATPKGKRGAALAGADAGVYIDLRGSTFIGTDEGLIRRTIERIWEEMAAAAGAQPQGAG
jgi:hypothetical protein